MAHSPSPEPETSLAVGDADLLLDIADSAIVEGLRGSRPSAPPEHRLPPALRERTGLFVTLEVAGGLNGCIGSIEGEEPIGLAAARHAWSAAFADPRLPVLHQVDYPELTIEVSVLTPLTTLPASSRHELLEALRPDTDGLVIAEGRSRGVFLPAVWEQLPEPEAFLDHLQRKAGMRHGPWPATMQAWRFTATKFARRAGEQPNPSEAA
jgi:AmmeMemoRadiSam system protein A